MNDITPDRIRAFLLSRYADKIKGLGLDVTTVPDTFDFLQTGTIDSFGVLEMVSALESAFNMELDMAQLDAEKMTVLGPLSNYVAENAKLRAEGL
jgi:acyl carrier protein